MARRSAYADGWIEASDAARSVWTALSTLLALAVVSLSTGGAAGGESARAPLFRGAATPDRNNEAETQDARLNALIPDLDRLLPMGRAQAPTVVNPSFVPSPAPTPPPAVHLPEPLVETTRAASRESPPSSPPPPASPPPEAKKSTPRRIVLSVPVAPNTPAYRADRPGPSASPSIDTQDFGAGSDGHGDKARSPATTTATESAASSSPLLVASPDRPVFGKPRDGWSPSLPAAATSTSAPVGLPPPALAANGTPIPVAANAPAPPRPVASTMPPALAPPPIHPSPEPSFAAAPPTGRDARLPGPLTLAEMLAPPPAPRPARHPADDAASRTKADVAEAEWFSMPDTSEIPLASLETPTPTVQARTPESPSSSESASAGAALPSANVTARAGRPEQAREVGASRPSAFERGTAVFVSGFDPRRARSRPTASATLASAAQPASDDPANTEIDPTSAGKASKRSSARGRRSKAPAPSASAPPSVSATNATRAAPSRFSVSTGPSGSMSPSAPAARVMTLDDDMAPLRMDTRRADQPESAARPYSQTREIPVDVAGAPAKSDLTVPLPTGDGSLVSVVPTEAGAPPAQTGAEDDPFAAWFNAPPGGGDFSLESRVMPVAR